ncbi:ferredoxin [Aeromicrobium camelliae]|uniref:Ferredoxin n=1 Tax=Aeromicrobium camelliae TaxID=1538144 RepID=A0A3N6WNB5_9ACTN|nr:ferredoxin [Aeromicrobium camelliae]RQN08939.1 ferredoxin [Aeromicrobium camelliae]
MFIEIDATKCMGHGRCYAVAPDLLTDDDEGFVAERGQRWEVPADLLDQAQEAVDACPEGAIAVSSAAPVDA